MRQVAAEAVPGCRRMRCTRTQPCLNVLMAGQAELGPFQHEELGQFGFMGAVALRALTGQHGGMLALPGLKALLQFAVALIAERILFRNEHPADVACMGIMAGQAVLPFEGDMECLSALLLQ